ncbi:Gfo/Idh/MocA family oxidoreductase [Ureibacillus chungkukjangi]|uniref:Gfo/Idh/MocA family oxidoreductase n=1 Tax=Ureibacillus chungkukjangi TaxID=1202712 RepID=UPI00203F40AB|nr:Gfo/Idh/MocA family oxidoreductase [Ureibacillus chungkukjangi]MCM3389082.1 Gfo/Idh/MocA family oxidoreductase [Ureibacillus chungkukjangi]
MENKLKIIVIGVGNIGKRHVEALIKLKYNISLYIVDKEINFLHNQKFLKELNRNNIDIFSFDSLNKIQQNQFDIGIIATNSVQRLEVLRELIDKFNIKYIILEKFLFPYINEYQEAFELLKNNRAKVYVNCGRREWESYKKLKDIFRYEDKIRIEVIGGNWNLPSNLIHFVDLFHYFTNFSDVNFDISEDSIKIIESKRNGYINFLGHINIYDDRDNKISLSANKDTANGIDKIIITSENNKCIIQEQEGSLNLNGQVLNFTLEKVSDLTNKIIESLIENGECNLTPFFKSMEFHLDILKEFNKLEKIKHGVIT